MKSYLKAAAFAFLGMTLAFGCQKPDNTPVGSDEPRTNYFTYTEYAFDINSAVQYDKSDNSVEIWLSPVSGLTTTKDIMSHGDYVVLNTHRSYLGGRDRKGDCKVNELSRLILKVYNEIGIFNPKIQIKVSNNTPKDFIYQALKMIQGGNTSIVFCHDEKIVKCLMNIGATYEDALDSVISGCYEYKIKNDEKILYFVDTLFIWC